MFSQIRNRDINACLNICTLGLRGRAYQDPNPALSKRFKASYINGIGSPVPSGVWEEVTKPNQLIIEYLTRIFMDLWKGIALLAICFLLGTGAASGVMISSNWNEGAVQNGPQYPATFTFEKPFHLLSLETYHWNNGRGVSQAGSMIMMDEQAGNMGPGRRSEAMDPEESPMPSGHPPWTSSSQPGPMPSMTLILIPGRITASPDIEVLPDSGMK